MRHSHHDKETGIRLKLCRSFKGYWVPQVPQAYDSSKIAVLNLDGFRCIYFGGPYVDGSYSETPTSYTSPLNPI